MSSKLIGFVFNQQVYSDKTVQAEMKNKCIIRKPDVLTTLRTISPSCKFPSFAAKPVLVNPLM